MRSADRFLDDILLFIFRQIIDEAVRKVYKLRLFLSPFDDNRCELCYLHHNKLWP